MCVCVCVFVCVCVCVCVCVWREREREGQLSSLSKTQKDLFVSGGGGQHSPKIQVARSAGVGPG